MTENKRFELTHFDCDYITDHLTGEDYPTIDKDSMFELVKQLNELVDENEQLKQYIKNSYMGSVCDNCEHCKEIHTNDWFNGIVHDAECEKGHIDMDISDCEDFKLTSKVFGND